MILQDSTLLKHQCYLNGTWIDADEGGTIAVTNPANAAILAHVPKMGVSETRRAIEAAEAALPAWRALPAEARAACLRRWFELLNERRDDLAAIMTHEQGKPFAEAKGEIAYAASYIGWYAEEAVRVRGDVLASPWADKRIVVLKEPVGVCAAITPWNFPAAMITRKIAPALAAGCTVVVKPASQTPLTALALAELADRAGVPAGVVNVLTGSAAQIGAELTRNPLVRKLSFTGSTDVGRTLATQCGPTLKKLSMELGGNAPFIVFDDADVEAAVQGALASKFRNTGQTCVCTNRFLVQAGVYDAFATRLAAAVANLRVGYGMEELVTQGPLIDQAALEKVEALVGHARERGARVLAGGRRHALGGTYYEPTVLADVTPDMSIANDEIFGPVATLFRFEHENEAVTLANATEYGLAGYFYTRDLARAWRVAERLECGMVGINTGLLSTAAAPFGGVKQSGMGREGSSYGIDDYLHTKYVCVGGLGPA
ncbi:NAD-dependent succinate-semialdehyde dehydrogenase [Burkholderia gladioli]|uniref:Succinic semialdehyde dehydrogenase n=1 Tax=Burkholderia gladioli (strain BSR3) TaxID=999541 RepID=F2LCC3_BURGS|nr:NAD-dependent succinate-semialdehyde dehydrogenase [Burkholderia gladioli]AEA60175.1 succinic semialdehyde dehydrogenase [Burkholderia gladioli BSR3]MBW5287265.1 NAD-dependent succinate-semialdehyde dehydrogenase [Burkholderia gladioli]